MLPWLRRLQSMDAGIRRKTRRVGALRDHDGRPARPPRGDHGHDHRRDGPGRPARRLLPEPALAGQARDGHPDHHETPHRRQRTDPECDGRAEAKVRGVTYNDAAAIFPQLAKLFWSLYMKTKKHNMIPSVLLILILASSGWAQTPAPASLTPEERELALKNFQTTRDNFLKSIAGLSEKQWTFKPAPDRWSVAEVSEHITVAESSLFGLVQKQMISTPVTPEKREQVKGKDEIILQKVPDRSHKVQAPEFLRPTGRWATEADVTKAFE